MSLEFLQPDAAVAHAGRTPVARSAMEREAEAAGARFEVRDGWNVAVDYAGADGAARTSVGWADVSHLGKVEVQAARADLVKIVAAGTGGAGLRLGTALRAGDAWWCPVTPEKLLVLGDEGRLGGRLEEAAQGAAGPVSVVDLTSAYGALTVIGPQARETFARFTALDLRPASTPVAGFRPGSVARTPGYVLREAEDRYLLLFGWALGSYLWEQMADAAGHLGGAPIGVDALPALAAAAPEEAATRA